MPSTNVDPKVCPSSGLKTCQSLNRHTERLAAEESWRTSLLIEYLSVGTYFNDHAAIYVSGPGETPGTPLVYHKGPWSPTNTNKNSCQRQEATAEVGKGHCWFVDSQASNNW